MTAHPTITELMKRHHHLCDAHLRQAEAFARAADLAACSGAFATFRSDTLAHFAAEEEVLFPAFERSSGMSHGPTQVMRVEHRQMRELLEDLAAALADGDLGGWAELVQPLGILMQQHNLKEENILYPMCDRGVAARPDFIGTLDEALHAGASHV
ncbi:MAG TPA: hemerythrin domain-containing protein [Rhodocyclaceae bacterium]|nr:hemerythrin domain-containing protein [Rhodocyclaceae bacterium]